MHQDRAQCRVTLFEFPGVVEDGKGLGVRFHFAATQGASDIEPQGAVGMCRTDHGYSEHEGDESGSTD